MKLISLDLKAQITKLIKYEAFWAKFTLINVVLINNRLRPIQRLTVANVMAASHFNGKNLRLLGTAVITGIMPRNYREDTRPKSDSVMSQIS